MPETAPPRRWLVLVLCVLLGGAAGGWYGWSRKPSFQATAVLEMPPRYELPGDRALSVLVTDLPGSAAQVADLLSSPQCLERSLRRLDPARYGEVKVPRDSPLLPLVERCEARTLDSQRVQLQVRSLDARLARDLAVAVVEEFLEECRSERAQCLAKAASLVEGQLRSRLQILVATLDRQEERLAAAAQALPEPGATAGDPLREELALRLARLRALRAALGPAGGEESAADQSLLMLAGELGFPGQQVLEARRQLLWLAELPAWLEIYPPERLVGAVGEAQPAPALRLELYLVLGLLAGLLSGRLLLEAAARRE